MEKQMKELLCRLAWFALGMAVCGLLGWLLPKWGIGEQDGDGETRDTVWVTRTRVKPVVRDSVTVRYVTRTLPVERDTVFARDTTAWSADSVAAVIPITQKVYRDSAYTAWVSGYEAALDSIRITSPTVTVTRRVPKRWGVGVQAGYGTGGAYIGVGISYNIITF